MDVLDLLSWDVARRLYICTPIQISLVSLWKCYINLVENFFSICSFRLSTVTIIPLLTVWQVTSSYNYVSILVQIRKALLKWISLLSNVTCLFHTAKWPRAHKQGSFRIKLKWKMIPRSTPDTLWLLNWCSAYGTRLELFQKPLWN